MHANEMDHTQFNFEDTKNQRGQYIVSNFDESWKDESGFHYVFDKRNEKTPPLILWGKNIFIPVTFFSNPHSVIFKAVSDRALLALGYFPEEPFYIPHDEFLEVAKKYCRLFVPLAWVEKTINYDSRVEFYMLKDKINQALSASYPEYANDEASQGVSHVR